MPMNPLVFTIGVVGLDYDIFYTEKVAEEREHGQSITHRLDSCTLCFVWVQYIDLVSLGSCARSAKHHI